MLLRISVSVFLAVTLLFGAASLRADEPSKDKTPATAEKKAVKKEAKAKKKPEEKKAPPVAPEKKPAPPEAKSAAPAPAPAPAAQAPAEKPAEKPAKPAPPTHTVKKDVVKIQIELEAAFEPEDKAELILRPEEWTMLSVLEAVPHGSKVKKGDVVLKLDPEKLDKVLADTKTDLRIAELSLTMHRQQLAALEKTGPLDQESGQRAQRNLEEDHKYYFDTARPESLKSADMSLKFMKRNLDYQRQELEQLEQMYKADDLVEETEKIVLQRQKDQVEMYEYYMRLEELDHDRFLKTMMPRRDEQIADAFQRQSIQWQKEKINLPLALEQQRLEVKKNEVNFARAQERLKNLEADRKLLTVAAPMDGILYYGRCHKGRFPESAGLIESLRRGGGVGPNQIFMTVVNPRPVILRTVVNEAQLNDLHIGSKGTATPAAIPNARLPVTIEKLDSVPMAPGTFDATLDVTLEAKDKAIMPGMGCKVKFVPYLKTDALVVPPKTVFAEPQDDDDRYVYVLTDQGKPEKRSVTVGRETGKGLEILKGLQAGDKILLEEPKDEK